MHKTYLPINRVFKSHIAAELCRQARSLSPKSRGGSCSGGLAAHVQYCERAGQNAKFIIYTLWTVRNQGCMESIPRYLFDSRVNHIKSQMSWIREPCSCSYWLTAQTFEDSSSRRFKILHQPTTACVSRIRCALSSRFGRLSRRRCPVSPSSTK